MSRRFWLGTPKGQNTSAVTSFLTSRLTNTTFNTSAPTLTPTTFITQWYTPTPTSNLTTTNYNTLFTDPGVDTEYSSSFITNYITNFANVVPTAFAETTIYSPTSNQTFKGNYNTDISTTISPGTTQYTVPTTSTSYTPTATVYTSYTPTPTTYDILVPTPTNYTYFYTYDTLYLQPTSHPTTYTSYTTYDIYRSTEYSQNTTVTGYFYTTFTTTTTPYTYPDSASGCYLYNVDGSPAGTSGDTVPANCSIVSCTPAGDTYSTGNVLTDYPYSQATWYVSTYISTQTTYTTTSANTYVGNGLGAPPFSGCYPEIDAAEYCANPESNCYPCAIYEVTSTIATSYANYPVSVTVYYNSGYTLPQYTQVSYLSASCLDCSLTCDGVNISIDANPTGGYVAPSSRNTAYNVNTVTGQQSDTIITPGITYYDSGYYVPTQGEGYNVYPTNYPGTEQVITQYTNLTPGTTQYTNLTPVQETRFDPTTYTSFSTTLTSILETTAYDTETGITTSFRDTDYPTSNPTSKTTTTTFLQNTGATSYEVPTSHQTTTTYDTDTLTQQETSRDTEVITTWLTDDDITTSFTTSRSTTWFTQ